MALLRGGIFGKERRGAPILIVTVLIMSQLLLGGMSLLIPNTVEAATGDGVSGGSSKCTGSVLGFPHWANGLPCVDGVPQPKELKDLWIIVGNVAEMIIVAAGYVATGFFIWGSFNYIISRGDPGKITEAKNTLLNSVIGIVIVLASVAIINFVQASVQ